MIDVDASECAVQKDYDREMGVVRRSKYGAKGVNALVAGVVTGGYYSIEIGGCDDCCIHLFADDEVIDLYDELKKEEEMEENVSEEMGKEAELIMEEELEEEMEKTLKTLNHRNKTSKCWHRLWYTMIQ